MLCLNDSVIASYAAWTCMGVPPFRALISQEQGLSWNRTQVSNSAFGPIGVCYILVLWCPAPSKILVAPKYWWLKLQDCFFLSGTGNNLAILKPIRPGFKFISLAAVVSPDLLRSLLLCWPAHCPRFLSSVKLICSLSHKLASTANPHRSQIIKRECQMSEHFKMMLNSSQFID